jgi:M-phase inducer tyrosine phosphatase
MDVDSPAFARVMSKASASPCPSLAGSIEGSPGLGSFFVDSPAAPSALPPSKRRSIIDDSPCSESGSPTAKRSSLGRKPEKVASSSALLFPRPATNATRRAGQPYCRRPLLSAVQPVHPPRSDTVTSAFPILQRPMTGVGSFPRGAPAPMRRAQSVCDQPKMMMEMSEDESEFEASPSVEYARRTGSRVAPRVDGSPGFKPMRSSLAIPIDAAASPSGKCKKASPYGSGGMPRFGDNEMDGKILPCHKVKEDGLVRVAPDTVSIFKAVMNPADEARCLISSPASTATRSSVITSSIVASSTNTKADTLKEPFTLKRWVRWTSCFFRNHLVSTPLGMRCLSPAAVASSPTESRWS